MDRRQFLRNCALIAAGAVAANQIDLLEKITGPKSFFFGPKFDRAPDGWAILEVMNGPMASTRRRVPFWDDTPVLMKQHGMIIGFEVNKAGVWGQTLGLRVTHGSTLTVQLPNSLIIPYD